MATKVETYNSEDIERVFFERDGVRTEVYTIYFKETATALPQAWWSGKKIIEVTFTYCTDYWGENETTETWRVEENTTWEELIKTDPLRFGTFVNSVIFSPSISTTNDDEEGIKLGITRADFFRELALVPNIPYQDNGTSITYCTDRISYFIASEDGEVKPTDVVQEGAHYFLVPRVKGFEEENVPIQRVFVGDNKVEIEESTIALFVCRENGKYRVQAQSDNAYIEYMLDNVEETYEVENNEFEIELTNNDNLKIICSTQDYSSGSYNLRIEKIE